MLKDQFERNIDYLRISVTDRCNLSCLYCSPSEKNDLCAKADILSFDSLFRLAECAVELGVTKIRITGGEPLIRKGLMEFVRKIAELEEVSDLSLTSNGMLLESSASKLKASGARRVNVSLDSLVPEKFRWITRGGELKRVLRGIDEALEVGLSPVRINTVVMRGINDDELIHLAELSIDKPIDVRFIELMPMGEKTDLFSSAYLSAEEAKATVVSKYKLDELKKDFSRGPATYYQIPRACGKIGFISPISQSFCGRCNRIRLTADGDLIPCLAVDKKISFKNLVQTEDKERIKTALKHMVWNKPTGHRWNLEKSSTQPMLSIGG
jgi:cyclic pyranopterin phosphate synthase